MESLRTYLKDIKTIPLLNATQERELAIKIKRGDAEARRVLTVSNLRLVISIAKRYAHLGVPLLDLIEEGNLGLMKAVSKYNHNRGFRFSTYGAWWIRQYITRAIANQGKTVRIPVYMTELISKFKRASETLSQQLGRRPTLHEISRRMRLSLKRVGHLQELIMAAQPTSLEMPVGEEGETEMIDLLPDETRASPRDEIGRFLQSERIGAFLKKMTERERAVLTVRYGLADGIGRTLGEAATAFKITRERVRQIEVVALQKLHFFMTHEGLPDLLPQKITRLRSRTPRKHTRRKNTRRRGR